MPRIEVSQNPQGKHSITIGKPVRVLDLCGGSGLIVWNVFNRYRTDPVEDPKSGLITFRHFRPIQYVGIDEDHDPQPVTFSLNTRRKTYIPEEYRHRCLPEPSEVPQPRITRVQSVLDWKNAEQIGEQIRKANEAAGEDPNTGFDEIHFHMPDSLPRHQTPGEKQSLLNVLSIFLIPGGYFHHTFERTPIFSDLYSQRTSPYTEHTLLHQDSIEPCTDKQIDNRYRSNGKKIRNAAASAGLRLEKYGFRCWPKNEKESEPYWMTRPGRTENSPEHKLIKATLKEYTQYGAFMNHYVILGKPRKHQKKRQNQ